jgi:hypothetical protein
LVLVWIKKPKPVYLDIPVHPLGIRTCFCERRMWRNKWFDEYAVVEDGRNGMEVTTVAGAEKITGLRVGTREAHSDSYCRIGGVGMKV